MTLRQSFPFFCFFYLRPVPFLLSTDDFDENTLMSLTILPVLGSYLSFKKSYVIITKDSSPLTGSEFREGVLCIPVSRRLRTESREK